MNEKQMNAIVEAEIARRMEKLSLPIREIGPRTKEGTKLEIKGLTTTVVELRWSDYTS